MKWISTKDKLPGLNDRVVVKYQDEIYVAWLIDKRGIFDSVEFYKPVYISYWLSL